MRRFGEPPARGQVYHRRRGAYAILLREGRVLLTHQALPLPEVQLPGGGIDPGESALAALHREVREETGWSIGAPRRLGAYRRFTYMPDYDLWAEKICEIWLARPLRRLGPPSEPHHRPLWAGAREAAALLAGAGDRAFLAALLAAQRV